MHIHQYVCFVFTSIKGEADYVSKLPAINNFFSIAQLLDFHEKIISMHHENNFFDWREELNIVVYIGFFWPEIPYYT